jgi:replicative DNA helicase
MADEDLLKKLPPHNLEAEKAVLGAMLNVQKAVALADDSLIACDFYDEKNSIIFESLIEMYHNGKPTDIILLRDILESKGVRDKIGGDAYLAKLTESVPAFSNISHYIKVILDSALSRAMLYNAIEIADDVSLRTNIDTIFEKYEERIYELQMRRSSFINGVETLDALTSEMKKKILETNSKLLLSGMPSGFYDFDMLTDGFRLGDYAVLAARPSMGKSALAETMAYHMAQNNFSIGYFSLEMTKTSLFHRLSAMDSMIPKNMIRRNMFNTADKKLFEVSCERISKLPIIFDDTSMIPINDLCSVARYWKGKYKVDVIFIDHIQLISVSAEYGMSKNRNQELKFISNKLRKLAKDLNVCVIALSQLSRGVESRNDK